jgi:hypothetical protein
MTPQEESDQLPEEGPGGQAPDDDGDAGARDDAQENAGMPDDEEEKGGASETTGNPNAAG